MSKLKDPKKPYGPVTTRTITVEVDKEKCIGAATCVAVSPKSFDLDGDAKAVILTTIDEEEIATIIDAARSCPVGALIIKENGKQIYPGK